MKKTPSELDAITDVVLAYRPKPKTKAAKRRKRKKKAADAKNTRESRVDMSGKEGTGFYLHTRMPPHTVELHA